MRKQAALWLMLLCFAGTAVAAGESSTGTDRASGLVIEMMQAMGGPAAMEKTHYLRFDWVVEQDGKEVMRARHLWDRYTGRYRVEWQTKEGKKMLVLFNVNTQEGKVWVNGQPAQGKELEEGLKAAYGRFINDSYWLLEPWKLQDPGVSLSYVGEKELNGQAYDLVHVSFGKVGLTPGDNYWIYINRKTHLMDRWAYFLESYKGKPSLAKATPWEWKDWQKVGPIMLAKDKVAVGKPMKIYFPVLEAPVAVEASVFESRQAAMPGGTEGN